MGHLVIGPAVRVGDFRSEGAVESNGLFDVLHREANHVESGAHMFLPKSVAFFRDTTSFLIATREELLHLLESSDAFPQRVYIFPIPVIGIHFLSNDEKDDDRGFSYSTRIE